MNCIPPLHAWRRRLYLLASAIIFAACGVPDSESADQPPAMSYRVHYAVTVEPATADVEVSLRVTQSRHLLREMTFAIDAERITGLRGDGELLVGDQTVTWRPGSRGGELHWRAAVNIERGNGTFDAWLGPDWGIFRAEDIIPRATTRTLKGAYSETSLAFRVPTGWSAVTEYRDSGKAMVVDRPARRFDQPTGWIATGKLGIRRETIADIRVAVVAPEGQNVRRMDMLALLNWTLPELVAVLPDTLHRLTIISAGEPMWRGGLSAPASLYIHSDRPLISENATSALLHEVMHTALSFRSRDGYDWITEGLAEYYSVELLRRSRAITTSRHKKAIADQQDWAKRASALCARNSTGAGTALAVTVFRNLHEELVDKTNGKADLDSLVRLLVAAHEDIDLDSLTALVEELTGSPSDVLHIDNLPGCRSMGAGNTGH